MHTTDGFHGPPSSIKTKNPCSSGENHVLLNNPISSFREGRRPNITSEAQNNKMKAPVAPAVLNHLCQMLVLPFFSNAQKIWGLFVFP